MSKIDRAGILSFGVISPDHGYGEYLSLIPKLNWWCEAAATSVPHRQLSLGIKLGIKPQGDQSKYYCYH